MLPVRQVVEAQPDPFTSSPRRINASAPPARLGGKGEDNNSPIGVGVAALGEALDASAAELVAEGVADETRRGYAGHLSRYGAREEQRSEKWR